MNDEIDTLLVDVSNVYWRNKSKLGHLSTSDGRTSGGLYGTFRTIEALDKRFDPLHIIMALDMGSQFRRDIDPNYKSDRGDRVMWEEGHKQAFWDWCCAKGYKLSYAEGYEADDVIAHYARNANGTVVIVSSDHDFKKCLSDDVMLLRKASGDPVYTIDDFRDEHDLEPDQYILVQAIIGDKSDNVAGVKGVTEEHAVEHVKQYAWQDLMSSCNLTDRKTIEQNLSVLAFVTPDDIIAVTGEYDEQALVALYDDWEMASLKKRLGKQ